MIVANFKRFRGRDVSKKESVPEGRCEARYPDVFRPGSKDVPSTQSYRPYGTGRSLDASQAINCLATIIQSLRDKVRQAPLGRQTVMTAHIFDSTSQNIFEDEDDDDDEDEWSTSSSLSEHIKL